MITPLEIYRARKQWGCGWFVAWTRLRCRHHYWDGTQAQHQARPAAAEREVPGADMERRTAR